MKREVISKIPLRTNPFQGLDLKVHRALLVLFLLQFALVWAGLLGWSGLKGARWPDGLLIVLFSATTVAALSLRLPGQNVMLASTIILIIAGAAQVLSVATAIPFGPFIYTSNAGQILFHPLPWAAPLIWLTALLNARGVGRLILRPWRKTRNYGFWLMGVTAALMIAFDLGLEPFATRVKEWWLWSPTHAGLFWYGAPWVNFIGWAVVSLLMLAFTTPFLINKRGSKQPLDYHPLLIWLLIAALLITGSVRQQLWPAAGVTTVLTIGASIFAIRGARW